ncbi:histidine kinase, partial [Streptomyces sp. SID4919]|uniref:caspase, EACC1-associated type n=1 Tax=Streptomyces sp. SID4919 TaxID=2690270 RepID=UPI000823D0A2
MATPPDPAASRAVLIGVGKFDSLASLPAVENSVRTLGGLLTRTDIWGLPEDNCHVVVNPQTPRELSKPVSEAADQATDTLLVYYAGHGLLEPGTGQLHLAVGHSDQRSVHDTAAPYDWIRRAIERSPAARRIVIADCCYSARAFGVQSAKAHLEVDGTFLLAAAAENAVAIAPPGEDFTAFTGELIKLLDNGIQEAGEYLDLDTIYRVLRVELGLREMPEPHRLCRDHLGKAPFVRNIAFKPPIEENGANGAGHEEPGQTPGPGTPADLSDLQIVLSELLLRMATSRSLADTLQTVANGVVSGLGYELAAVNLVRPDGDLVVAAFAGDASAVALMTGRVGPRAAWDRRLGMGERWGSLIFIPHSEGWVLDEDDVPQWYTDGPEPRFEDEWHPSDRLFAPLWAN